MVLSLAPALVQGASRGIGLEFVRQLLRREGVPVIATCRQPEEARALKALVQEVGPGVVEREGGLAPVARLAVLRLDVQDEASIFEAAGRVGEQYGQLGLVLNCSGLLHGPQGMRPETSVRALDPAAMMLSFQVNAMGPALVAKHMLPLLAANGGKANMGGRPVAVLASLSARVSSISDNSLGGWHSYRASKASLNQYMKCIAVETARKKQNISTVLLHPGTVDTDMSKPFQRNVPEGKLFAASYSVERLLSIIDSVTQEDNGRLYAWDGQPIPW